MKTGIFGVFLGLALSGVSWAWILVVVGVAWWLAGVAWDTVP